MRVNWHPEAEREMIEAAWFYDRRVAGLGSDFLDAIDAAVDEITADPERFEVVENEIRRHRVKRFTYCVYYRFVADSVRILVVKHHSRHPDYWKHRQ